ncbi:SMODS domain-containing nucleotidyltransferase [Alkalibacterium olivapovliticus]|uniref:Nucleotidyltransferase-like protein n=1 Tax=Alkalibacterium olivapovliticus TaxID=99907 RepID=A0A2T0VSY0_9LACT|nr:nucleotidyltransferase [Alkalibacterium olivapovliticus]PRY73818.1 hypothetical protein CLV38_1532 [Alkalibacterium olivapovliticus]
MTEAKLHFIDFLKNIRLSKNQVQDLATGHKTLRKRLLNDENLSKVVQTTFLQGSYRRNTAVKPKNGSRSDVDIIVVTNIDHEKTTPQEALDKFVPFLEKYYKGKYDMHSRSIGIELSYVDLDLVITTEIENEQNLNYMKAEDRYIEARLQKSLNIGNDSYEYSEVYNSIFVNSTDSKAKDPDPILIPDRDKNTWEKTNPLAQINWTIEKNGSCNNHYINVVKAIKWWKKQHADPKYPKGYPLEHFVGEVCPDGINSIAHGVVEVFERIVKNHSVKPVLKDHGVPTHDVFARITDEEYAKFYVLVEEVSRQARDALEETDTSQSVTKWRELFGNEFPAPSTLSNEKNETFTERKLVTQQIGNPRFG